MSPAPTVRHDRSTRIPRTSARHRGGPAGGRLGHRHGRGADRPRTRPIGADRGEVAIRGRLHRPVRRGTVVSRQPDTDRGRRQRHRRARRHLPRRGRCGLGTPGSINRVRGPRARDGRDAAPNDSAALLLGARLLRLPPRGAWRQRCRPHLRVPPVRHLDARRVPQPAAARRDGGQRADTDDGCRLPLDEPGRPSAAQGNPGIRQADSAGSGRPGCWAGATPRAARA